MATSQSENQSCDAAMKRHKVRIPAPTWTKLGDSMLSDGPGAKGHICDCQVYEMSRISKTMKTESR